MLRFHYRCSECAREYPISADRLRCDECSRLQEQQRPLRGLLEVVLTGTVPPDWVPTDLLPVERKWFPEIPVGDTPLWQPRRLQEHLGTPGLYLKDDGLNPTGSLKDRASWLVSAFARSHGIQRIVVASTGNAGSSMAGIGAAAGLEVRLYLPASAPVAKLTQSQQYGADLQKVDGTYDEAFALSLEYLKDNEGLTRNTGYNPLTIEGKKTVSLEIYRQLGNSVPDYLFVSTGDGVIISGVYRGFEDLVTLGLAERVPHIISVQAEGSSAISRALRDGSFGPPLPSRTVADSISVDVPAGGLFALQRLQRHGGSTCLVTDAEILAAQRLLASGAGCFAEPASATAFAGFLRRKDDLPRESRTVVLLTGNGLKDIDSAVQGIRETEPLASR
jgi:threonine synthase